MYIPAILEYASNSIKKSIYSIMASVKQEGIFLSHAMNRQVMIMHVHVLCFFKRITVPFFQSYR